jgi:hypothetical protein
MSPAHEPQPPTDGARYGYFVIQTRATHPPEGVRLTGVVEDLRTGEKRAFASGEALARLIHDWSAGDDARDGAPDGVPP